MSIYENISLKSLAIKRPFRIFANAYSAFASRPKTSKPFKIKFESSAICNLKCIMCPLTAGLKRKTGFLKFENFKKVFDEIKVPYLNLTGLGEPLLNPDIFKIIKYAKDNGSLVKLDTNATLLNEENARKLLDAGPAFVSISLDGITKEKYEKIRKGAKFEIIIENLKNFIKLRNETKHKVQIQLFFVVQKDNIVDLPKYIKFAEEIGADVINSSVAMSFGKADNKDKREIPQKEMEKIKSELAEIKKTAKIKMNFESVEDFLENPETYEQRLKEAPCFYPWYNPCITWDGYVVPCDVHCDNEIVFGNAFEEPFMKIWNNQKAQEFRKQLLKSRIGVCSRCFVDESFILEKLKLLYKIPIINKFSKRKI